MTKETHGRETHSETTHNDDLEPVREALAAGRKIEAVKRYREIKGVGLKEAKQAVETMAANVSPAGKGSAPDSPPRSQGAVQSSSGCGSVVLVGVGLFLLAWIL